MVQETKPKREQCPPGYLSSYRKLWRGTQWAIFIEPGPGFGFSGAKKTSKELEGRPGIYEFALSRGLSTRFKVYVGETGSLRARHGKYLSDGDHLRSFFEDALANGCTIWRRWRYVASKEEAVQLEASLLGKYDWAWNQRLNGRKRNISLQPRWCCFCIAAGMDVAESEYVSPAKAGRPVPPAQPSPPRKPRVAKQLQFLASA